MSVAYKAWRPAQARITLLFQLPETPSARQPSCTCSSRASMTRPPALWTPATPSRKPTPKVRACGPLGRWGRLPRAPTEHCPVQSWVSSGALVFSRGPTGDRLAGRLSCFNFRIGSLPVGICILLQASASPLPLLLVCAADGSPPEARSPGAFGSGCYISDPPHAKGRGKSVLLSELTCRSGWEGFWDQPGRRNCRRRRGSYSNLASPPPGWRVGEGRSLKYSCHGTSFFQ